MALEITFTDLATQYYRLFNDVYIHAFTYMILLDILTGLAKAWRQHKLNSSISSAGLIKHCITAVICISVYPWLLFTGFKGLAYGLLGFFTVNYAISNVENLDALGVKFPKWVTKRLEKIKKDFDEEEKGL